MARARSLSSQPFPLLDDVIAFTDIAMSSRSRFASVELLSQGLSSVLRTPFQLPKFLLVPDPWNYVRHELYRSPEHDYQIIAITWAPGQGSGIHDHGNMWGVEAVLAGRLEVTDYLISEERGAWARMEEFDHKFLEVGNVIGLLPPHDLHACRNPSSTHTAVSLHIYGKPLEQVRRYVPASEDLYREAKARLHVV
jgi:predicted metal-dependent enzyme (double-stranded beta helix superfamily)